MPPFCPILPVNEHRRRGTASLLHPSALFGERKRDEKKVKSEEGGSRWQELAAARSPSSTGWRPGEGFDGTGRASGGNTQQAAGRNHAEPLCIGLENKENKQRQASTAQILQSGGDDYDFSTLKIAADLCHRGKAQAGPRPFTLRASSPTCGRGWVPSALSSTSSGSQPFFLPPPAGDPQRAPSGSIKMWEAPG